MLTHKQRILIAARDEIPDILPYVPRIDLWYNAHSLAGTLPERHKGRTQDEISRAEGWALHKIAPEFLKAYRPEDNLHRAIGVYSLKETVYTYRFSPEIEIQVERKGDATRVEYQTPIGMVSTTTVYTEEMRKAGASIIWIQEHIIKKPEDYRVVAYLFENLELIPKFDDFVQWKDGIGQDGLAVTVAALAASPMHHIQKEFLDATLFYYHYSDYRREMQALAEGLENYYMQLLKILAESPAEAVLWGGNFDETITYPPYFEKEILPWIRKAVEVLGARGKIVICHCDRENQGLMDLIRDSGMHVAEAVCPYPMTKVKIEEYYARWSDKLTLWGGLPEVLLSARAMNEALSVLEPHLASGRKEAAGKVLIGTVRGDLHDIGKNMVVTLLRGAGLEVLDMGVNVSTEEILRQVEENRPDILGLSALLTTTLPEMRKAIDALQARGLRDQVKVMVGGAPVNEKFARDIGADGYAPGAGEAVTLAKQWLQKEKK